MEQEDFSELFAESKDNLSYFLIDTGQTFEALSAVAAQWILDRSEEIPPGMNASSVVPPEAFKAICRGVFWLAAAANMGYPDGIRALVYASKEVGFVYGMATGLMRSDDIRRAKLSNNGVNGGKKRHAKTHDLKSWVVAMAKNMRDSDVEIARKLSMQLPQHLVGASKNPERLIYEALRARYKPD